jgi:hypothetical protein
MSIIHKLFNRLLSLFGLYKQPPIIQHLIPEEEKDGEVIRPWKFADPDPEDDGGRDLDESLRLKEKFLLIDREKQAKLCFKTRDPILQLAALETGDKEVILSLIRNPRLEEEVIQQILLDPAYDKEEYRKELAKKFGLPLSIQKLIVQSKNLDMRREFVLWQKPIHPAVGILLAEDEDNWIRITIAKSIGEGIKVENMLFFKGKYDNVYRKLMVDENQKIRDALARNLNLGEVIQKEIAQSFFDQGDLASLTQLAKNKCLKLSAQEKILELSKKIKLRILEAKLIQRALRENESLDPTMKIKLS